MDFGGICSKMFVGRLYEQRLLPNIWKVMSVETEVHDVSQRVKNQCLENFVIYKSGLSLQYREISMSLYTVTTHSLKVL